MFRFSMFFAFLFLVFVLGCTQYDGVYSQSKLDDTLIDEEGLQPSSELDWREFLLTDLSSGESFALSNFSGKFVFLESFAVWCPTCLSQQKELSKITNDSFVVISIDTDPNEDENSVLEHVERYGFDWRFSVSPLELTRALREEFGLTVISAPSAPVILICPNQSSLLLENGVKNSQRLLSLAEEKC